MTIKHMKSKNKPDFCFCCGKELPDKMFVINLGSPGATFELCKTCLKKMRDQADKSLQKAATL